jgi:hypothetical protein
MSHTTRVVIICDVCASTHPTNQTHNVRKARGEARAAGWVCTRGKGDLCPRCARTTRGTP